MAAVEDIKGFWDAVAKGIEQARDPVAAAVKAIADGEKNKEKLVKAGVAAAIKAQQDAERERKRILDDAIREEERERKKAADKAKKDAEDESKKKSELNSKYLAGLSAGLSKVAAIATSAMSAITGFGNQLAGIVGQANPAAVHRWQLALADSTAVLGRTLTPVLEKMTVIVQRLGNAFASLSPQTQRLIAGMTGGAGLGSVLTAAAIAAKALVASLGPIPIIVGLFGGALAGVVSNMSSAKSLGDAFSRVLGALGTAIEAIAEIAVPLLTAAIEVVTPLLELFADAISYVASVITSALASIGLSSAAGYDPNSKSSTGAAVRQAQIGDLSSFASRNYTSAYGGATNDIAGQSLRELKKINDRLEKMNESMANAGRRPEDRTFNGSSAAYRSLHPFERGSDGKTNFQRGAEVLINRMARLFN